MGSGHRSVIALSAAILAAVSGAQASGTPIPTALAHGFRRAREDEGGETPLLLQPPRAHPPRLADHSSHSSHSSHYSGSGYSPGRSRGSWGGSDYVAPDPAPARVVPVPPPRPLAPARVSFVAYPGGRIYVDDRLVGTDSTRTLRLTPGTHTIRVENSAVGNASRVITVSEGQSGVIVIDW